jgi:DNA-binding MarR family transcriptional regulator
MTKSKKSAPNRMPARRTPNDAPTNHFRLDLPNFVPYRISILATLIRRAISEIYRDQPGLTEPEWKVLTTLAHEGPLPSGDIGLHMTLDRMAISRALMRLIELGLVSRAPYERDQRMSEVNLSPVGSKVFDGLARQAAAIEESILRTLDRKEIVELLRLINKLESHFRAYLNPGHPLIRAADEISRNFKENAARNTRSKTRSKRRVKGGSTATATRKEPA